MVQDKTVEQQLDERFADVVAARAAANGAAAAIAEEESRLTRQLSDFHSRSDLAPVSDSTTRATPS